MSFFSPRDPDEYLLDTERRVIRVRRHWAVLAWDVFETAALLTICVLVSYIAGSWWILQNILWYAALLIVLRFVWKVVEWWIETLVVTDKRFIMTRGLFTTRVLMMPISKVTDLTYQESLSGRMLGYGSIIVESAGQIQALNRIDYLPRPKEFYDTISELVFGDKKAAANKFSMAKAQRAAKGKPLVG